MSVRDMYSCTSFSKAPRSPTSVSSTTVLKAATASVSTRVFGPFGIDPITPLNKVASLEAWPGLAVNVSLTTYMIPSSAPRKTARQRRMIPAPRHRGGVNLAAMIRPIALAGLVAATLGIPASMRAAGPATLAAALDSWDRGDYPAALAAYLDILAGPQGDAALETIALQTGELYRTRELTADG